MLKASLGQRRLRADGDDVANIGHTAGQLLEQTRAQQAP